MISAIASPPPGAGSSAALDCTLGADPSTARAASTRSVPARTPSRVAVLGASRTGAGAASSMTGKKTAAVSSRRTTQTRASSAAGYASKTTASAKKELAFLSDPKLSTEEKLFKFMAYMASKYDAEIEQKMKEIGGTTASTGTSSSSAPKKKGLFGGILGKVVKAAVPAAAFSLDLLKTKEVQGLLKTVSGPVLAAGATALGAPQLAPALLKVGPDVANVLIGVAKSIDLDGAPEAPASSGSSASKAVGSSAASSASKASSTSSSTSTGSATKSEQLQMMELQRLYEKQKEMMSLASNLLKGLHDMRMVAINNIGR